MRYLILLNKFTPKSMTMKLKKNDPQSVMIFSFVKCVNVLFWIRNKFYYFQTAMRDWKSSQLNFLNYTNYKALVRSTKNTANGTNICHWFYISETIIVTL